MQSYITPTKIKIRQKIRIAFPAHIWYAYHEETSRIPYFQFKYVRIGSYAPA